jgi:hypothetical protein
MDAALTTEHAGNCARIDRQWRAAKHAILAYHVGAWRVGESPLDALARALDLPREEILAALANHRAERDELDALSACLGPGWAELAGLSIMGGVSLAVTMVNEKLARVPPEVRTFFGAPRKLEP